MTNTHAIPPPPHGLEKAKCRGIDIRYLSVDFGSVPKDAEVELHRYNGGEYSYALVLDPATGDMPNVRGLENTEWEILRKRGVI